ncbi:S-adenosyl-L-methionine-dependent methyltransferase [Artomyces pyxidatus]|uniref:S-adenosyl-L-methionine-dependent methyltransferase n=1 Tax=Artomyces pyxidatus TaxID=48021 RepID=A0ACB8TE42_9AGAM|nr:S-adenosyl-L-methionine-dependent methyltransferase [Artomyces pyxidatus]
MPPLQLPSAFETSFPTEEPAPAAGLKRASPSGESIDTRKAKKKDSERPGHYIRRKDEVSEETVNIIGEEERPESNDDKPIRVLSDFTIFDAKDDCLMVSLDNYEENREICGAGIVTPYFINEEDEGQEDDDDEYPGVRVALTALLRQGTMDYTKRSEPIYIDTQYAWYILAEPSKRYRPFYTPYYNSHKITQRIVCAALDKTKPTISLEVLKDGISSDVLHRKCTDKDLQDAIAVLDALIADGELSADVAASALVKHLRRQYTDALPPSSSPPRPSQRRRPQTVFKLAAGLSNKDLDVLRPENQNPTHVTPRIGALAFGYFRESLFVLGPRQPAPSRVLQERQRKADLAFLKKCLLSARNEHSTISLPPEWRLKNTSFTKGVRVDDENYFVGDVVVLPIGQDPERPGKAVPKLPLSAAEIPIDAELWHYFWFGKIIYINGRERAMHVQWFEHSSTTYLEEISIRKELFITTKCNNVKLESICGKVAVTRLDHDEAPVNSNQFINSDFFFYRFLHHRNDASFIDPHDALSFQPDDVPDSCQICTTRQQEDWDADGHWITDVKAPAQIGQICAFKPRKGFSREVDGITVKLLGRISSLENDIRPSDVIKDEHHLFITDEIMQYEVSDLIQRCYVIHLSAADDLALWRAPDRFYVMYHFPTLHPQTWASGTRLVAEQVLWCKPCLRELDTSVFSASYDFVEAKAQNPWRVFDIFAGTGAFSLGMESAVGVMRTTHAVEVSPSAAETIRKNSPDTIVYNQCANVVLCYAVKQSMGILPDDDIPMDILGAAPLPSLPKPGDIDIIVAGFPCQPHSRLNMFQRANDVKSNLILNLLSWVDFLKPKYCIFENVRGFLSFQLGASQVDKYRVQGGIEMGGVKFLGYALLNMNYQVRFGLLQAGHYGTPQTRVRFFLLAAKQGYPLPDLPQPVYDFPFSDKLAITFPNGDIIHPINTTSGLAPFNYITVEDAIGDLKRFNWEDPDGLLIDQEYPTYKVDMKEPFIGPRGVEYDYRPQSLFQSIARLKLPDQELQHYDRPLKPAKVKRPGADYRSLPDDLQQGEWQVSNPMSAVAKNGFRPGLYGRLDATKVFQTTVTNVEPTAKQSRVLHPWCNRVVTVRELARSQGFPDSFTFYSMDNNVKTMQRQIGNAVPWPVSRAIGMELRKVIQKKWQEDMQNAELIE